MLYVYLGTDRQKARTAMHADIKKHKGARTVLVSDAHTLADLSAALQGGGLFAEKRVAVLDSVLNNEEMRALLMDSLKMLGESDEPYYLLADKVDAATKRALTKYAEKLQAFDAVRAPESKEIFKLKFALQKGDKKTLWLGLQKEFIAGKAPEMVHGFLFWAAKDMHLKSANERSARLVAALAALPHEARRQGEGLDYALERFVLSGA